MIWLWIILIAATVLNIIWIINAAVNDVEEIFIPILVFLLGVGLIGWLILGHAITFNKRDVKIDKENFEIIKGNRFIIISDLDDKYFIFDKKVDFDQITDTTTFYSRVGETIYGGTNVKQDIFYFVYNDTIQNMDTISVIKKYKVEGKKLKE